MLEQDKKNQDIFNPWKQKGLIKIGTSKLHT